MSGRSFVRPAYDGTAIQLFRRTRLSLPDPIHLVPHPGSNGHRNVLTMETRFRISICNLQTGIATTRGYWHYLTTAWKYMVPHRSKGIRSAARYLEEEQIDVASLCEVDGGSRRTQGVDQLAALSALTGLPHQAFFPTLVVGSRINQGNAVCSRFPATIIKNHALPGHGEPRFVSEAELSIGGTAVRLFVTHLSLEKTIRHPQICHIVRLLERRGLPTILAGDFNISAAAELDLLHESSLSQATSAATFPSWKPTRHLDHLFFSRHFSIEESATFERFRFSDHLPFHVTATLRHRGRR